MEKSLRVIWGTTIKGVVDEANRLHLTKDDIIEIVSIKDQVYLVYYA